jgi:hypothetical protein
MLVPSKEPTSALSEGKINKDEKYHLRIDKKTRHDAMCLINLSINSIGASPSQVKEVEKERYLLHSWTTILISLTPS